MQIDILTLFPKMFPGALNESILKRAQQKKIVSFSLVDIRNFSEDKHRKVDDRPFGGGPGMVIKAEPALKAIESVLGCCKKEQVILLTPQGEKLNQSLAKRLTQFKHLVLVCGHYEGIDARVGKWIDQEISIGDYILTGGEIPAMVVIDAVVRLLPGVVGNEESTKRESFQTGLLEYPHYTRPAKVKGMKVPKILLSGDHRAIEEWRLKQAALRTKRKRPDLLKNLKYR